MPLESRIKVFTGHKKMIYASKDKYRGIDISVLSYTSFILAVNQYVSAITDIDKNTLDIRTNSLRKFTKREKLLSKWALIKELKYHKLEVVHSTIFDLWKEFEENKKGEQ